MLSRFGSLVLVLGAVACGSSPTSDQGGNQPPPGGGTVTTITIGSGSYSPASTTVPIGQTVRWSNMDVMVHTATSDGGVWDSGSMGASMVDNNGYATGGGTYQRSFATAGTFPYHCTVHPTMQGMITVTP